MTAKIRSIHVARNLMADKVKRAESELVLAGRLHKQQRQQHQTLLHKQQTHRANTHTVKSITMANLLQEHQSYLKNLEQRIERQQQDITTSEQEMALLREDWLSKKSQLKALERVIEKHEEDLDKQQRHREALEADEIVQRKLTLEREEDS